MLGLKLFIHSVRLIFWNFKHALKISFPLLVTWIVGGLLVIWFGPFNSVLVENIPDAIVWGGLFTTCVGLCAIWTAVGWHRFVLLDEYPTGILPKIQINVLGYIWRGLLIGAALGIVFVFVSLTVSVLGIAASKIWITLPLFMVLSAVLNWSFYLLSPMLPAAALGKQMSFADAWSHTEDFAGSIFIASVAMSISFSVFEFLFSWPVAVLPYWVAMGIFSVGGWIYVMVSISILTTIYGVVVEDRDL